MKTVVSIVKDKLISDSPGWWIESGERVQSPFILSLSGRIMLSHNVFLRRLHLRLCEASSSCFTRQRYWSRCGCDGRAGHEHTGFLPRVPSAREWTKIVKKSSWRESQVPSVFYVFFSQRVWHVRADHIMIESQFPFLSGVDGVFLQHIYMNNWWGSSIWGTFIEHVDACIVVMFCLLYLNLFDLLWPLLFNHHFNYILLLCSS